MKLIIGLGNPGKKYSHARHNVGYMFIDALKKSNPPKNIIFKKTNAFMNHSGPVVKNILKNCKLKIEDLIIVHDDLDLPLGEYKINQKSPKDHQGILSIEKALGSTAFDRIRIGIDNRNSADRTPGEKYVLEQFSAEEKQTINSVIKSIINDLLL